MSDSVMIYYTGIKNKLWNEIGTAVHKAHKQLYITAKTGGLY